MEEFSTLDKFQVLAWRRGKVAKTLIPDTPINFSSWLQVELQSPEIDFCSTPSFGHSQAHVCFRAVFVRSTPRSGRGGCYPRTGTIDPTRTLAEQFFSLFLSTMPRGVRHGRGRLGEQSYEPLGRLLDSFTLRA